MPPQGPASFALYETDFVSEDKPPVVPPSAEKRVWDIVWKNVILFSLIHLGAVYGAYLFIFKSKWTTSLFTLFLGHLSGLGITAGVHRLWTHKSYKARWPLRVLLTLFNSLAAQNSVIEWARDHRMHHKYSETDADPHNATRGFFFSHVGWLLVRKHPEVKNKGHTIDMSDLWADPILRFQKKYYLLSVFLVSFILPLYIPTLWGESFWNALFVCANFRYVLTLHTTWLVNSAAHLWGNKPYDRHINPVENKTVSLLSLGEGFHNYHHTFPWDYKTAELGTNHLNVTKAFIDMMSKIGWAYDLKTVSHEIIEKRVKRTGDGSHDAWGWDDKDVPVEFKEIAMIINPKKAL